MFVCVILIVSVMCQRTANHKDKRQECPVNSVQTESEETIPRSSGASERHSIVIAFHSLTSVPDDYASAFLLI